MTDSAAARSAPRRPDLEGLRAVAVVLVVLFHAGVKPLAGGYIGVDVFFVLSGFLITGLLVTELETSGRIALTSFYARRARRILPASILVLAVTLALSAVILAPVRFATVTGDIAAAALYVPNVRFALDATDYWHPGAVSPVLHFWSLGVEEQFYLVWPTFLILAASLGRRSHRHLLAWIVGATVVSLILGLLLTPRSPTAAFYLLPTRAWELGAGAMLVFAGRRLATLPWRTATSMAIAGVGLIVVAALAFDARTPFPGVAAIVPVAGAALVILAGAGPRPTAVASVLSARPLQFLGRISYSLYLWHWPLIVLGAAAAAPREPVAASVVRVTLEVAAAVVLAAATYRWLEDPLRHGRAIGTVPRRNLGLALAASLCLVAIAVGSGTVAIARFVPATVAAAGEADPLATDLLAAASSVEPSPTRIQGAPDETVSAATSPNRAIPLPLDMQPPLVDPFAAGPAATPRRSGCGLNDPQTEPPDCVDGDRGSDRTVVLFGDSHAMHWFPAMEWVAEHRGWRLVTLVKASCPYEDLPVMLGDGSRPFTECAEWRENAFERIAAEHPMLVVVSANHDRVPVDGPSDPEGVRQALLDGEGRTIERLRGLGAQVVVLGDTPTLPFEPVECLSRHADDITQCAIPRSTLFDEPWLAGEQSTAHASKAGFVDTADWLCPGDACPLVVGGYLVYRDTNHISLPLSWALSGRLDEALASY